MERGVAARNDRSYVSAARSLLRLMWLLDFVQDLLRELLTPHADGTPLPSLAGAAGAAYQTALAPHHPWVLRKTVGGALMMLGTSREAFFSYLGGSEADMAPRLQAFAAQMLPVRESLWGYFRANGIADLP